MPKATISKKALEKLIGKKLKDRKLADFLLYYLKADPEKIEGDEWTIKFEDTNRPDLWSVEGIARALRPILGMKQKNYKINKSNVDVFVEYQNLNKIRPFIACAIVKGVNLDDEGIKSLIQAQDKLDTNYGRKRKKASIGIYDFDRIAPPIYYKTAEPEKIKFIPLGFNKEMNLKEILETHPKGIEYGHLIKKYSAYPILIDSKGNVLSMPPIINSNYVGKVDETTHNLFVEVTGTDFSTVLHTLNLIASILIERGGKAYSVKINYVKRKGKDISVTPTFYPIHVELKYSEVDKLLGLGLNAPELKILLENMGYKIKKMNINKNIISLDAPFYRKDIMHAVDVIEDVAISYGYNKIEPVNLEIPTYGKLLPFTEKIDEVREILIGMGLQELMLFNLISKEALFEKLNKPEKEVVILSNPINKNYECVRNSLIPSLLLFLSKNTKVEFPQKVYEIGDVLLPDKSAENCVKQEKHLCVAITHSKANYTEIKSHLDTLFKYLKVNYKLKHIKENPFIGGRCGAIFVNGQRVGIIGEIHPSILDNFGLENPVVIFEINLEFLK